MQNGDERRLGHFTSCTDRQEVINTYCISIRKPCHVTYVWWIVMLTEPITYATQNGCFEVQEKLKVGLDSTEVTDGSIRFNPRLSSDPLW